VRPMLNTDPKQVRFFRHAAQVAACFALLSTSVHAQQLPPALSALTGQPGRITLPANATNPAGSPNVDIAALARRFEATRRAVDEGGTEDNRIPSGLFVFVSLGMPKPALTKIISQAEITGAMLVLRGLVDGSLGKTAIAVKDVMGERKVGWFIDPRLFKLYGIERVPATVMVEPGASMQSCQDQHCNSKPVYVKVSGDVSMRYALEQIEQAAPSSIALLASAKLKLLDARLLDGAGSSEAPQ
jgi:conjugal transfer pilus assembly protein TrbC